MEPIQARRSLDNRYTRYAPPPQQLIPFFAGPVDLATPCDIFFRGDPIDTRPAFMRCGTKGAKNARWPLIFYPGWLS